MHVNSQALTSPLQPTRDSKFNTNIDFIVLKKENKESDSNILIYFLFFPFFPFPVWQIVILKHESLSYMYCGFIMYLSKLIRSFSFSCK